MSIEVGVFSDGVFAVLEFFRTPVLVFAFAVMGVEVGFISDERRGTALGEIRFAICVEEFLETPEFIFEFGVGTGVDCWSCNF